MAGSLDGGGSERQTLLLAKHLDRQAFRPFLYLRHRQGVLLDQVPADVPILTFDEAPPTPRPRWPGRVSAHHVRYLRQLLQQHAIDVIYDRTFQMTMVAGPAAASLNLPRVSTIVSPPALIVPMLETQFLRTKRRRLATAYARSFQVLAVSEASAASAAHYYGLPPSRIRTIRNPIDIEATHQRAGEPCEVADSLDRNVRHWVCIGRLSEEKGQRFLIAALQRIAQYREAPPWMLWIVGGGPHRPLLEQQAEQLGVADRIRFTGHLANPLPLLARADALILPSLFEGLPNVVLEAMCLKIPVIATNSGGTAELIEHGRLGRMVPAADAEALAVAIAEQLFQKPDIAPEISRRTREAALVVQQQYASTVVVPQIADVLAAAQCSP